MALLAKKQQQTCSPVCRLLKWTVCALLLLVTVAAFTGVFQTHVIDTAPLRVQFGSTSGSLSILSFTVAVMAWMKQMVCCMNSCEVCSK